MIQFDDHIFQYGSVGNHTPRFGIRSFRLYSRWGVAVDKDGGIFVSDERRGIVPRPPNLSEDPQKKGPFSNGNE